MAEGEIKIEIHTAGIRELLKSQPVAEACKEQAQKIKTEVGNGFEVQSRKYPERTGYAVSAESREAVNKVYQENVLLKAIGKV